MGAAGKEPIERGRKRSQKRKRRKQTLYIYKTNFLKRDPVDDARDGEKASLGLPINCDSQCPGGAGSTTRDLFALA